MDVKLNDIITYFAKANASFAGIFTEHTLTGGSEKKILIRRTNPFCGGLAIALSGNACFTLNGTPYLMKPGTVVHAGPDMGLSIQPIGEETWRFVVVHYHIPYQEMERFPLFQNHFSFFAGENARISDLIHQLLSAKSTPGPSALFKTKLLFMTLLGELWDSARRQFTKSDFDLIEQLTEYVRQNYTEPLTIGKIAEQFELDRRRLSYLFERHIGMSPLNYLIEYRILKAKELLCTCTCSVKQVAECVGYTDNLYFSRAFKKQTGFSPMEYRKQMENSL